MTYSNNNNASLFGVVGDFIKKISTFGGNSSGTGDSSLSVPTSQLKQAGQNNTSSANSNLSTQQNTAGDSANSTYSSQLQALLAGKDSAIATHQAQANIDTQAASDRLQNQLNLQSQAPGSSSFAGYQDGIYNYNPQIGGTPTQPNVSYQQTLNPQVGIMREQDRLGQQDATAANNRQMQATDNSRYNQGLLSAQNAQEQSNLNAAQYQNQLKLAGIDAQSRLAAAQIGAQGSVLGSLFGGSGNSINGRYWS